MPDENLEIVRRSYEPPKGGLKLGQIDDWLAVDVIAHYFDPAVEWVPTPDGLLTSQSYRGYEGLRRFWTDLLSSCDELAIEPLEFSARGEQVVVVQRMNIKARGIVVDEVWSRLYQLRDGRIIRVKTFTNPVAASEEAAATPS